MEESWGLGFTAFEELASAFGGVTEKNLCDRNSGE